MKNTFAFLLLLIPITLVAQDYPKSDLPIDSVTKKVTYLLIQEVPGINLHQLHLNAKEWIAKKFNSAQHVTQLDDSTKIVAKGFSTFDQFVKGRSLSSKLWFTVTITMRPGKYKFQLTDFETQLPGEDKLAVEPRIQPSLKVLTWLEITPPIKTVGDSFITTIVPAMSKKDDF